MATNFPVCGPETILVWNIVLASIRLKKWNKNISFFFVPRKYLQPVCCEKQVLKQEYLSFFMFNGLCYKNGEEKIITGLKRFIISISSTNVVSQSIMKWKFIFEVGTKIVLL